MIPSRGAQSASADNLDRALVEYELAAAARSLIQLSRETCYRWKSVICQPVKSSLAKWVAKTRKPVYATPTLTVVSALSVAD